LIAYPLADLTRANGIKRGETCHGARSHQPRLHGLRVGGRRDTAASRARIRARGALIGSSGISRFDVPITTDKDLRYEGMLYTLR